LAVGAAGGDVGWEEGGEVEVEGEGAEMSYLYPESRIMQVILQVLGTVLFAAWIVLIGAMVLGYVEVPGRCNEEGVCWPDGDH